MWRGRRGPATGHGFVWMAGRSLCIISTTTKGESQTKPSTFCAYATGQSPGVGELVSVFFVRRTHSGELNKRGKTPQRRSLNGWREINWLASGLGFSVNRQDRVPCESTQFWIQAGFWWPSARHVQLRPLGREEHDVDPRFLSKNVKVLGKKTAFHSWSTFDENKTVH